MKKITFGFLVAMLVVFTGCSQKDVEVAEETKTEAKSVEKKEQTTQETTQPMASETQTEQSNSTQNVESTQEMAKAETSEEKVIPTLENIYFDYDKFVIKGDMRSVLKSNYSKLEDGKYDGTITLEGHCDERGSNEYNFALGLKRAQSVKTELIGYGVNPAQIKIMSYGENKPLCTKQNEDCWSKNRRVESILD